MTKIALSFQVSGKSFSALPARSYKLKARSSSGFTLIELMVSVSIFAIVMMIAISTLLTLVDASKKAQAIESVMNNLNFALENMSRNLRVGTDYHCQESSINPSADLNTPADCTNGGVLVAFEPRNGSRTTLTDQVVYRINGAQLERSIDGGTSFIAITAPEVNIQLFRFYVDGTSTSDARQPKVILTVKGEAGVSAKVKTSFNIQAMVTQRLLDI